MELQKVKKADDVVCSCAAGYAKAKSKAYTYAVNNIEHLHKDLVKSEYERLKMELKEKSRLVAALEIGLLIRNHIGMKTNSLVPIFRKIKHQSKSYRTCHIETWSFCDSLRILTEAHQAPSSQ